MSKTTARSVLLGAAKLLEEKGWTREGFKSHGRMCVVGALRTACHGSDVWEVGPCRQAEQKLRAVVRVEVAPELRGHGELLFTWNDTRPTKAPVIEALRAAART